MSEFIATLHARIDANERSLGPGALRLPVNERLERLSTILGSNLRASCALLRGKEAPASNHLEYARLNWREKRQNWIVWWLDSAHPMTSASVARKSAGPPKRSGSGLDLMSDGLGEPNRPGTAQAEPAQPTARRSIPSGG